MDEIKAPLAEIHGVGRVQLCECNSIHVKLGALTITLAPEEFANTARLIRDAMEKLVAIASAREASETFSQPKKLPSNRFTN